MSLTLSSTRLPAAYTQAPIGSLQVTIPSSGEGSEPIYLSALHRPLSGDGTLRIPTIATAQTDQLHNVTR